MKVSDNHTVRFNEKEKQLFTDFADFMGVFDEDFCECNCEDCPYIHICNDIFGYNNIPVDEARKMISFFEMIDPKED